MNSAFTSLRLACHLLFQFLEFFDGFFSSQVLPLLSCICCYLWKFIYECEIEKAIVDTSCQSIRNVGPNNSLNVCIFRAEFNCFNEIMSVLMRKADSLTRNYTKSMKCTSYLKASPRKFDWADIVVGSKIIFQLNQIYILTQIL